MKSTRTSSREGCSLGRITAICFKQTLVLLLLGAVAAVAESDTNPEREGSWAMWEPQVLKAPIPVELRRNPLQPLSPVNVPTQAALGRYELAENLSRALRGRIKSVIRSGALNAVFIDNKTYSPGQEVPVFPQSGTASGVPQVRLKAIESERLLFLVLPPGRSQTTAVEVAVALDPFCQSR